VESKQIDRRQFLTALLGGSVAGMFVMGSGSTGPAGSNANVGPGTINKLAKFLSTNTIGDSTVADDGTNITFAENLLPNVDSTRVIGSSSLRIDKIWSRRIDAGANSLGLISQNGTMAWDGTSLLPPADNSQLLGSAALRWQRLYSTSISAAGATLVIIAGNNTYNLDGTQFYPSTDNARNFGTAGNRWRDLFFSHAVQLINASNDANPTVRMDNAGIEFGAGGASATDILISRISGSIDLTLSATGKAFQPHSDNVYDLGTSSLNWRDGLFKGQVKARNKNVLVLDGQSMTQSSHTVSNADTDIATYSLGANSYTRVIVRVTGYVSFVTLSTNQSINLKILDGTTQVGNTMVVDGALSASASIPFTLEAAFVETGAVTIHFTEGAAAVDANTTVIINSIIVLAES